MRGENVNQRVLLRLPFMSFDLKIKLYIAAVMKATLNIFYKLRTDRIDGLLVVAVIIISIITQSPG